MKIIPYILSALLLGVHVVASAASVDRNATVAVMDFGTRPGATTAEININNAEHTSCDYIITRLVNRNCFNVMEKEFALNSAKNEGLNIVGLIDPDTAKRIGELLNAKYLIYGNVTNVSVSDTGTSILGHIGGGVNICTVKAHIMARMMDVNTGNIIMIAKGDGKSKSSFVKVVAGSSLMNVNVIKIGTVNVTQDSVHNAIQKAAYAAVDDLMLKLFNEPKIKI
ncbi:MAG: CsgG/HfaB family protein [Phascolarctobacterium sp.]|uniref:CsgG/HfaB family protein n=1 Tax=Phascolarctobacterium sp. TaxID=2049039 RepID=UPI0026DAF609|nr:CsgG/HfaB family protein [Phascolarctobacterium sp.]MDO4921338.1 CsgG/HfaB family protein [Phascolarctobacterium sp.]